ncbi:MAG: hypothetical protein K6T30_03925 [Alicyclobacillus sp.]|nr:hypothetical protein [Alicyclobacillus sp.]
MVTRAHAARFLGQHVVLKTRDGAIHHGILHAIGDDGVYIRPIGGPSTRLAHGEGNCPDVVLLPNSGQAPNDVQEAWWPFWFFAWWWLLWLWPLAWWW